MEIKLQIISFTGVGSGGQNVISYMFYIYSWDSH